MIRKKFYLNKQIATVEPYEEIIEFEDDTTDEEIQEVFTEWVFGYLDTAILNADQSVIENYCEGVKA